MQKLNLVAFLFWIGLTLLALSMVAVFGEPLWVYFLVSGTIILLAAVNEME
jgi:hypothetical protein